MTPEEWVRMGTIALAAAVLLAMALLFVYKLVRNRKGAYGEVRRAAYVAALGELAYRGGYPQQMLQEWVNDVVFREVTVEYLKFLDGKHRDRVAKFARDIGMAELLHDDLSSRRSEVRSAAAEGLAQLGHDGSIAFLIVALNDRADGVRINAAHALARVGDLNTIGPVLEVMDSSGEWVRSRIADALTKFGPPAVVALTQTIDDPSTPPISRRLLIQVLGQIGDTKAEPTLLAGLQSGDLDIRTRSAAALASAGSPDCVQPLIHALSDDDWRVRAQVAKALAVRMDPAAIPALSSALSDSGWWVRQNAASALMEIPGGEKALLLALNNPDHFARDVAREHLMGSSLPTPDTPEAIAQEIKKIEEVEAALTSIESDDEREVRTPATPIATSQKQANPKHSAPHPRTHTARHKAPRPRDRNKGRHRP